MLRSRLILVTALTALGLAPTLQAQQQPADAWNYQTGDPADWPPEADAVAAAPANHRVLLENDHVRVLEVTVAPGETEPVHHHRWPSALHITAMGDFIDRSADGEVLLDTRQLDAPLPIPFTMWKEPEAPHTVENLSRTLPIRLLRVEVKPDIDVAPGPDVAAGQAHPVHVAVTRASADHIAAINRQDADAFVDFFTETAVESPSDGSEAVGRDAIRENVTNFLAAGEASIELASQEVLPLGDGFAYQRAAVTMRLDGAVVQQGIITRLWAETPGGWKIARDTWTSRPSAD